MSNKYWTLRVVVRSCMDESDGEPEMLTIDQEQITFPEIEGTEEDMISMLDKANQNMDTNCPMFVVDFPTGYYVTRFATPMINLIHYIITPHSKEEEHGSLLEEQVNQILNPKP